MFKGEVTDELLEGIIKYCEDNMIADGWMGKFKITPAVRDELSANNRKFKEVMDIIPYISRDTINQMTRNIASQLSKSSLDSTDMNKIKLYTALLGKQMEFIYKMEKDTGLFKDEAENRRKRTVHKNDKISIEELEDIRKLLK